MRKFDDQSGRSMIEMLGVLAIVGVLSVAGIQGYSKAMNKYKINKVMDQVSTITANTKTMFASQGHYGTGDDALKTAAAKSLGLIPEEMTKTGSVKNGLNGDVYVNATADGAAFSIVMAGLNKEACSALTTSDWGGASGFKYLVPSATSPEADPANTITTEPAANATDTVTPAGSADEAFSAAADACTCTGMECAVSFVFY